MDNDTVTLETRFQMDADGNVKRGAAFLDARQRLFVKREGVVVAVTGGICVEAFFSGSRLDEFELQLNLSSRAMCAIEKAYGEEVEITASSEPPGEQRFQARLTLLDATLRSLSKTTASSGSEDERLLELLHTQPALLEDLDLYELNETSPIFPQ